MTTSRIKWSFVLLGLVAFLSAIALIFGVPAWAGNTQSFYSGAFAASLLLSIVVMAILGWQSTVSKDASQNQMDFMYKMTHELQTPVSSINLAADMLDTPSVADSPERLAKYVRIIKEEGNRMQWHIDNVLHIAKAESRTLLLKPEKILVDTLVSNLSKRYEDRILVELTACDASVVVDRQHFSNVLFNLIDNALKYTPVNPQIRVKTQQIADKVVVSVRDNGIGIPQNEQKKIFNNFYRVPENSANVKGFGLGLSYVQQIAQAHQWNLELESQEGEGSNFRIVLPVASSAK